MYVALESAGVERVHQLRQVLEREIGGPGPRIEPAVEPKVDGVGAIFDRRAHAVPITGRGEEFGGCEHE